jgi:hypothetical protein
MVLRLENDSLGTSENGGQLWDELGKWWGKNHLSMASQVRSDRRTNFSQDPVLIPFKFISFGDPL